MYSRELRCSDAGGQQHYNVGDTLRDEISNRQRLEALLAAQTEITTHLTSTLAAHAHTIAALQQEQICRQQQQQPKQFGPPPPPLQPEPPSSGQVEEAVGRQMAATRETLLQRMDEMDARVFGAGLAASEAAEQAAAQADARLQKVEEALHHAALDAVLARHEAASALEASASAVALAETATATAPTTPPPPPPVTPAAVVVSEPIRPPGYHLLEVIVVEPDGADMDGDCEIPLLSAANPDGSPLVGTPLVISAGHLLRVSLSFSTTTTAESHSKDGIWWGESLVAIYALVDEVRVAAAYESVERTSMGKVKSACVTLPPTWVTLVPGRSHTIEFRWLQTPPPENQRPLRSNVTETRATVMVYEYCAPTAAAAATDPTTTTTTTAASNSYNDDDDGGKANPAVAGPVVAQVTTPNKDDQ